MSKLKLTTMERGARFSVDGKYRFLLWRIWDKAKGLVCYVGLNPSVAGAEEDDNTVRRLIKFTEDNGYGGFYIVNLFSEVATDFKELKSSLDPNDFRDNYYIMKFARKSNLVCLMYGDKGVYQSRNVKVLSLLSNLAALGKLFAFVITKRLNPGHPLYLPNGIKFKRVIPTLGDGSINEFFK